jgi:trk system potassium uptake protein TrkH
MLMISIALLTLALSFSGLDLVTSLTGTITALMNVGPGFGETIGPSGNFSTLPDSAKWILCLGMLLGRLEFLTIVILFSPVFWKG